MRTILWSSVRKQKREMTIFGGASLALLVLAALVWLPTGASKPPAVSAMQAASQRACLGAWSGIRDGFTAFPAGNTIRVFHPMTTNPRQLLGESSLGIALCHSHFRLQSFCLGSACKAPGLTLILSARSLPEDSDGR